MQLISNKIIALLSFLGLAFAFTAAAQPVCPICVVAIGAGLGLSQRLGIDDVVSSIWIGALLMALVLWTNHWLAKKNWNFNFYQIVVFLAYYLFTLVPLWLFGIVGHPLNKIFGIDKIIFGASLVTIIFYLSLRLHFYLKKQNSDKVYFPYQRVAIPVAILFAASLIAYYLLKY
jgi:hypothetical protein